MSCGDMQILKNPDSVDVRQKSENIQILQGVQMVRVCSTSRPVNFLPFSFTATENGQTVFGDLPTVPVNIVTLAVTGTIQDPAGTVPDYTWSGKVITLSFGVNLGDTVYGMIQTA